LNNGLWDLGQCPDRCPQQISLEDYAGNLAFILQQLRATGAQVIWRSTTPVRADRGWRDKWLFLPDDISRYNAAAEQLMRREGVPCHDLGAFVQENLTSFQGEDGVHLSPAGQEACAEAVVEAVSPFVFEE